MQQVLAIATEQSESDDSQMTDGEYEESDNNENCDSEASDDDDDTKESCVESGENKSASRGYNRSPPETGRQVRRDEPSDATVSRAEHG